ncbi:MAG: hypothetical protein QNJ34_13730 [Xenococcaceae cyanobacterium MO_188.B29]|nr:hypothetical protein [Xenococcaceae cyanobacterium MO_188.B29]
MNCLSVKKQVLVALVGSLLQVVGVGETAEAANFNPAPLFPKVNHYNTTVTTNGDSTDIFFPVTSNYNLKQQKFPIALLLPGSRVDTSQYSEFAKIVASYGFTVVVPERIRSLPDFGFTGLLPEVSQVNDVLEFMLTENSNPDSPIAGTLDTDNLVLLGHSFGGAVGLSAIDNSCIFPLCERQFQRPEQLRAGAFFGTSTFIGSGEFLPINNQGIPIALVVGSQDGLVTPELTQADYNNSIQEPPKTLITVDGANHYGITNINNPPGARLDPNNPTLEQEQAIETIARWSALFLRAYAIDDSGAFDYINKTGDALDENVTVISQVKSVPEGKLGVSLFLTMLAFSILHLRSKLLP